MHSRIAFNQALCAAVTEELGYDIARRSSKSRQHVIFRIEDGDTFGTGRLKRLCLQRTDSTGPSESSTYRVSRQYLDALPSNPEVSECTHYGEVRFEDCYFATIADVRGPVPLSKQLGAVPEARVLTAPLSRED